MRVHVDEQASKVDNLYSTVGKQYVGLPQKLQESFCVREILNCCDFKCFLKLLRDNSVIDYLLQVRASLKVFSCG